jgi:exonuclease III
MRRNIDRRFITWNIRSLYRTVSLMTVSRELSRYTSDLVGVQEVRWEGSGTTPAGEYSLLYGTGNENYESVHGTLCKRITSAV